MPITIPSQPPSPPPFFFHVSKTEKCDRAEKKDDGAWTNPSRWLAASPKGSPKESLQEFPEEDHKRWEEVEGGGQEEVRVSESRRRMISSRVFEFP